MKVVRHPISACHAPICVWNSPFCPRDCGIRLPRSGPSFGGFVLRPSDAFIGGRLQRCPMGATVAVTAEHCLELADGVGLGRGNVCHDGWTDVGEFDSISLGDDLAIIRWSGDSRTSVPIASDRAGPAKTFIRGYGPRNGNGGFACEQQQLDGFVTQPECAVRPSWSEPPMCLRSSEHSVCRGWSGSGVYLNDELAGIVSGGSSCATAGEGDVVVRRIFETEVSQSLQSALTGIDSTPG